MSRFLGIFLLLGLLSVAPKAWCQDLITPFPVRQHAVTSTGVNPGNGQFTMQSLDLVAGSGRLPYEMSFERIYSSQWLSESDAWARAPFGVGGTHNFNIYTRCSPCGPTNEDNYISIAVGTESYSFYASSELTTISDGEGATLEFIGNEWRFRRKDGLIIYFNGGLCGVPQMVVGIGAVGGACRYADRMVFPSGEQIKFEYEPASSASNYAQSTLVRLKLAYNPDGYGFRFHYVDPTSGTGANPGNQRYRLARVDSFDASCGSSVAICSQSLLQSVSYTYSTADYYGGQNITSFTDPSTAVTYYENSENRLVSASVPNQPATKRFINSYQYTKVSAQQDGVGSSKAYAYATVGTKSVTTITYPGSVQEKFTFPSDGFGGNSGKPEKFEDGLGRASTYLYAGSEVSRITKPEGNYDNHTFDAMGNATETRSVAKPGSPLANIVSTASFSACTLSNFRFCNKPAYTINSKGGRTDYSYSPAHGEVTSIQYPADSSGSRPTLNFAYTPFTGSLGNVFYLLSSVTSASGTGDTLTTAYEYDPSKNYLLKGKIVSSGSQNLRTCYGHDALGRAISETAPAANLTSCP